MIHARLALVALGAIAACQDPAPAPAPKATIAPAAPSIPSSDAIRALLAARVPAGAGVVVGIIEPTGRRVIAHGASGARDARPLDGDTVFQIGSITKVFTTLLLADMVVRGEVQLHEPAAKLAPPGVTLPVRRRPFTLFDLATHRSGLPAMPTNFALDARPDPYAGYTVDQLHAMLASHVLEREPSGPKGFYSNLGVALLGRLLAHRAGTDYEALLAARVLRPLGLASTSVTLEPDQSARLAPGHDRFLEPVDTWNLVVLPGSGGLRSTANDLLRFLAAQLGQEPSPLHAAMLFQRTVRASTGQALGWGVRIRNHRELIRHEGSKEGYRTAVVFEPATSTGIVVLVNARIADSPMDLALHLLAGDPLPPAPAPPPPPPARVALDAAVLDTCAGRYRLASGMLLEVARRGDGLLAYVPGGGVSTFFADGPRTLFSNLDDERLTFELGAAGTVTGVVLRSEGTEEAGARVTAPL
jgi:serine-type D-Ala-D-Ala carboxypeptidase/endopeptidase